MKNIFRFLFAIALTIGLASCSDSDRQLYDGPPLINFNNGTSSNVFIKTGETQVDKSIQYGTIRPVSGNHQVSLVFDAANSTAVEGVDFQIIKGVDEISNGGTNGNFIVRILETGAVQAGKTAVFKIQSSTIKNAGFNNLYTMKIALTCPITDFVGAFENKGWHYNNVPMVFNVEESTTANQLLVKGFWDDGSDMIINYDPVTYIVQFPSQYAGWDYQGNPAQPVFARASTDASKVSSFNPCTRLMTLHVNYWVPALNGGFGNQIEEFTGL